MRLRLCRDRCGDGLGPISRGGQIGLANLIEQRPVRNAQRLGDALAIPVVGLQRLENDISLDLEHRLPSDLLERNGSEITTWDLDGGKLALRGAQLAHDGG